MQPGFAAIGPGSQYGMSQDSGSNDGSSSIGGLHHPNGGMGGVSGGGNDALSNTNNGGGSSGGMPQSHSEYTLAGILHYLQSEWRRYERDRNEWEIERAEMRARVALLEGERRSIENLKTDLMRRVKMLEFALKQERSKYVSSDASGKPFHPKYAALQNLEKAASSSGRSSPAPESIAGDNPPQKHSTLGGAGATLNTLSLGTLNGLPGIAASALNRHPSAPKDPKTRAKSREYLKQCLQEISYLTSPSTLNPLPERPSPGSVLGQGPPRPRKALPENAPSILANNADTGSTLLGGNSLNAGMAAARRQRPFEKSGVGINPTSGAKAGARGLQLLDEPLLEREEENTADSKTQFERGNASESESPVDGLALDKSTLVENFGGTEIPDSRPSLVGELAEDTPRTTDLFQTSSIDDPVTAIMRDSGTDDWTRLREAGQLQRVRREAQRQEKDQLHDEHAQLQATSDRVQQLMRQNVSRNDDEDLASLSLTSPHVDRETDRAASETVSEGQMWKPKKVLRGHLDAVRSVAFDATDLCLYSASDDNTIKFWRIDEAHDKAGKAGSGPQEVDPVVTLRGHSAAVTCLALSNSKRLLFSGSVDTSVVVWKLLDGKRVEPYPPFDKEQELTRLVGHTQAIWDICLLPTRNDEEGLLASASADGTVKIWNTKETGISGELLLTFDYFGTEPSVANDKEKERLLSNNAKLPVPTSVAACMSDLRRCAVAYNNSVVKLFDIQSGREAMVIKADRHADGTEASQINKVITHPTLPILITGHENDYIQFFDLNTGECTLSMVGHLDSVTTLDIDPSGLTLVSGGHDCSVRFWDIVNVTSTTDERKATTSDDSDTPSGIAGPVVCTQEISSHRKKGNEGVLFVKYHASAPWFCSAGADGAVRLYG